jgi:cullin 4
MATSPNQSLSDLADDLFRSVLDDMLIKPITFTGVCNIILQDRRGTPTDLASASKAVQMIIDLGLYTNYLEPRILAESQEYSHSWATSNSKSQNLPNYVQLVLGLFKSEAQRCDTISLSSATKRDLITLLEEHTIKRQRDSLVNETEVAALLHDNKVQDLEAVYSLLGRCELTDDLIPPFEKWIKDKGTAIVFDEEHEDDMIVLLLTLRKQVDNIWRVAFHSDKAYAFNIRTAFVDFMNKTKKSVATYNTENSKQGEMIAKYVDLLLKGGSKAIPSSLSKSAISRKDADEEDNEVQDESEVMSEQLDQVLDLFRFLQGKAVFEAFYKKDLARRLLMGRSASADDELSMLSRLKTECGDAFTHNLETMFKDIELSKEEMAIFQEGQVDSGNPIPMDIYVNVLCSAAWPTYPDLKANIPPSVKESLDMFEKSYKDRHTGRVLIWKHSLAHCQLKAEFPKGPKELVVSGFQAIVLLLFNFTDLEETLSYERIRGETGLGEYRFL